MVRQYNGSARPAASSSITDVAALANVSIATVSRVLSGKRQKDDELARRVREAAEQLNYSVNYAASSLRGAGTRTIGLVIPSATDPFCAQLLDALEPAADDRQTQLLLGVGATQGLQASRIESLMARNVDGLIYVETPGIDLSRVLERHAQTVPIVGIGNGKRMLSTSQVSLDNVLAMEQAIAHLASRGASTVAYLGTQAHSFEEAEQVAMLHTQIRTFGLTTTSQWNEFGDDTLDRGFRSACTLFRESHPDAVICSSDAVAHGVVLACASMGLDVPNEVMVIGNGNAAPPAAGLTTLKPPFERIVDESLRLIEQGASKAAQVALACDLVIRQSTAGSDAQGAAASVQ